MTPRGKAQPVSLSDQDADAVVGAALARRIATDTRTGVMAHETALWRSLVTAGASMRAIADLAGLTVAAVSQRVGGKS